MDHYRTQGTGFVADEELDFDLGLFDDEDNEPTQAASGTTVLDAPAAAPRRLGVRRPGRMRVTPNWGRILGATAVAALLLFMVVFGVRSFLHHRREAALKSYFTQVRQIDDQSDAEGVTLDGLLNQPTGSVRAQLRLKLEKLGTESQQLVKQAQKIGVPGGMGATQQWFVAALQYRHNGLVALSKAITSSWTNPDHAAAAKAVAEANQRLIASDVVYSDSFGASARAVLMGDGVTGITVPASQFVQDQEMASPHQMAMMLARLQAETTIVTTSGKVKPLNDGKLHGTSMDGVAVLPAGTDLTSSGINTIQASDSLAFEVSVTNRGDVQEVRIPVSITIAGANSSDSQTLTGIVNSVDPGQTATVKLTLSQTPTVVDQQTLKVTVGAVPGEQKLDNNTGTYQVVFKV